MSETLVLFPPVDGNAPLRWLRIVGDAVVARGDGRPELTIVDEERPRIVAVVPADAVALHWAELPDRSMQQTLAAARIAIAEASAAPVTGLHVAVGREGDAALRPIAVVGEDQMHSWLGALAADGIDPDALVPAPLLLAPPDQGYVRADLGGIRVVRSQASAFVDEEPLTALVTGDAPVATLTPQQIETAVIAAVQEPALNLRQGGFARQRKRALDMSLIKRLSWLFLAIAIVSLLITLVRIVRTEFAARGIEAHIGIVAQQGLPAGTTITAPERQLSERLASLRGAGLGFSRTAGAVFGAVQAEPATELTALVFTDAGALKVTVTAKDEAAVNDLKSRIAGLGFVVTPSTFTASAGQLTGDLTVTL